VASRVWLVSFSGIVIETTVCDRADVADAWIMDSYHPFEVFWIVNGGQHYVNNEQ
jgi:hypothetical protein